MAFVVGSHALRRKALELFLVANHRMVIRVRLIHQGFSGLVEGPPRLILPHRQLLKHDALLTLELFGIEQTATHTTRLDLERCLPTIRRHGEVVGCAISICESVITAAHLAGLEVNLPLTKLICSLEHHVLKEMRYASFTSALIARTDLIPEH